MNIDQIVNQKVERALGAALIRQIVLEAQVEELSKQLAGSQADRKVDAEAVKRK